MVYRHAERRASLDLDDDGGPAATPSRTATRTGPPVRDDTRVRGSAQVLLTADTPTVTLTRVQSGVGRLVVQAVCSTEVGDLRLAALYQLRSGGSSVVSAVGARFGPSSRLPVLVASRDTYDEVALDLRRVSDVERVTLVAFSESRTRLTWGGTLVVTTFAGGRLELPLESLFPGRTAVLASVLDLDGELVVRAEMEVVEGDVREAARAYGYDRITWLDDRNPVD